MTKSFEAYRYYSLGVGKAQAFENANAVTLLQNPIQLDRSFAIAADLDNVLGICFQGLSRYDHAVAAHQRYVALAPKEPNAHDSLGMSYQQWGTYAEAKSEYNAALLLNPRFEPAIIHLGDLYSQQGGTGMHCASIRDTST